VTDLEKLVKHFDLKGKQIRIARERLAEYKYYDSVHFAFEMEEFQTLERKDKLRLRWLRSLQNVSFRLKSRLKKLMKRKIRYISWR